MPKVVSHDERRLEIVEATWRIIAREGIEHAKMLSIAEEAGYTNGALKPYFPTKDDLLAFAFEHVFNRTNERIATRIGDLRGLAALTVFCSEVLPLDEERVAEARIVVTFWQLAVGDADKARFHGELLDQWRRSMLGFLGEAVDMGEISPRVPLPDIAEHVMLLLLGAQTFAALSGDPEPPRRFADRIDEYLRLVG